MTLSVFLLFHLCKEEKHMSCKGHSIVVDVSCNVLMILFFSLHSSFSWLIIHFMCPLISKKFPFQKNFFIEKFFSGKILHVLVKIDRSVLRFQILGANE